MKDESREIIVYDLRMDNQKKNYLVTEGSHYYFLDSLRSPDLIYAFLATELQMDHMAEENVILLAMDARAHVIGIFPISHGTTTMSYVSPQSVFKRLLLVNAVSFIVAHNHPSGESRPSPEDMEMTRRLCKAGSLMGIQLLDHIIVGDSTYYSFAEHDALS